MAHHAQAGMGKGDPLPISQRAGTLISQAETMAAATRNMITAVVLAAFRNTS